jgi:putative ABC transport system substrate-binding protein
MSMPVSRRRFALGVIGGALWPRFVFAAPPERLVRVGLIASGTPARHVMIDSTVTAALRGHGYVEGKNLVLVKRFISAPDTRMDQFMREVLASNVDVVIAGCGWSSRAAQKATQSTPIVMISVSDPVGRGYIKSLARPGVNMTGVTGSVTDLAPKMLDHLRSVLPGTRTVGVLYNSKSVEHQKSLPSIAEPARAANLVLVPLDLHGLRDDSSMRAAFRDAGVQSLLILPDDDMFWAVLDALLAVSDELKLPTAFARPDVVEMGGFMSYGPAPGALFSRSAFYVDKIVNGANPAELAVEQPANTTLSLNLKKAAEFGIEIPRGALLRADYLVK